VIARSLLDAQDAFVLGDALKIQVAAPPEKGKANDAVVRLLADLLNRPAKDIKVIKGQTSPRKIVLVRAIDLDQLLSKLQDVQK
jgi:uncharacterized protein YggU (UPF0235/DUF167 family)